MDKSIMPECYADTLLIETLVPSNDGYNHKHNCFKVESAMKNSEKFAVGIIDKDKKQIRYLSSFEILDKVDGSLILWKHSVKPQYIIQICPALEKWVLRICDNEGINIAKYGFANDVREFAKYTKSGTSTIDNKLIGLFRELSSKDNCRDIRKLKGWIRLLKEKNYQVDINELKNV
jgi:hypothetical protein